MAFGVTVLGRANYAQEAYYAQAFFSLCVGFERTSKLAIIVDHALDNGGMFPSEKVIRGYGHDLSTLFSSVEAIARRRGYNAQLPASSIHDSIIRILSTFATNVTRYFNIEVVLGKQVQLANDPVGSWWRDVTEPVLAAHYKRRRRERDEANAQVIDALMGPISLVRHESETGDSIRSPYAGAIATSKTEAARPWERMYVMQIARFLARVASDLGRDAQMQSMADIPYLPDFFAIFGNEDRYFRERKVWSIYH